MSETIVEEVVTEEVEEVEAVEGEDSLADAGKKALNAMKAERNAARQDAKDAKAERDALKTERENAGKPAEELALTAAEKRGEERATKAASDRVLRSELKAAAKGKLADPADVLAFLKLEDFEVGDDGEVDSDALEEAIDALLARKPHLAAGSVRRFDGGADQGGRGKDAKPPQLTQADIESMTPAAINTARKAGQLNTLLGAKN